MAKTECVVCEKEIKVLDKFKGEMMCEKCYQSKSKGNEVSE